MSAGLYPEAKIGNEHTAAAEQLPVRFMTKEIWDTQASEFIETRLQEFEAVKNTGPLTLQTVIDMSQELLSQPDNEVGINVTFDHRALTLGLIYYSAADIAAYGTSEWGGMIELTFQRTTTITEEEVNRLFRQLKPVAQNSEKNAHQLR